MSQPVSLRCPVCRASFRGTPECSRCGAELAPLMILAARAWRLRRQAREAIRRVSPAEAISLAEESQYLHPTPQGRRLLLLARLLDEAM